MGLAECFGSFYRCGCGQTLIPYLWLFVLGALVAERRDEIIPVLKKLWLPLLAITLILVCFGLDIAAGSYPVFRGSVLFLGLVGFAYCCPKLNIKTDISYGIYLYHMIVVNAMIALGFTGRIEYLLIVSSISCVLAWGSQKLTGIWMRRWK